ncbi:hypothetical protein WAF17_11240 [Bernardetia sp. ABR2-2B]|uniref:hypothetical protein n=1 Tax=Bernardetia sp. ABR2-2B TaxID=3127472 RepID=UPI0030D45055
MINKILEAKHWQLFFLLVGVPVGLFLTIGVIIYSMLKDGTPPDPKKIFEVFSIIKFFPLIIVLFTSLLFSWFWSVANGLQSVVPTTVEMKTTKFRTFSIIPLLYVSGFCVFIFVSISKIKPQALLQDLPQIPMEWLTPILLILHILSIFGIFYTMYFTAKTLKTVELQREVKFSDFVSEFFMFWFFPVGLWILQPRINEISEKENANRYEDEN